MKKKIAGVLAGAALVTGVAVGVPVTQAATATGVATAEARPDPGQGYVKCRVVRIVTEGGVQFYKACR